MSVLVNSMLKGEGRMDSAKLWPVACLGGRPQLLLLCVCDKALNYSALTWRNTKTIDIFNFEDGEMRALQRRIF